MALAHCEIEPRLGFELGSPCPNFTMITITKIVLRLIDIHMCKYNIVNTTRYRHVRTHPHNHIYGTDGIFWFMLKIFKSFLSARYGLLLTDYRSLGNVICQIKLYVAGSVLLYCCDTWIPKKCLEKKKTVLYQLKNVACCFEQTLEKTHHTTAAV